MIKATVFALLSIASVIDAGCDNSCSGHGACECGFCECYDNWGMGLSHDNGDCSDRICPFELAWVDTPDKSGRRHKYAECAGRGICDRSTGECDCFEGYEGKGCQRTTCPNDCSGHGVCEYIQDLGYMAVTYDYRHSEFTQDLHTFDYFGWDKQKTRGCVCDPEWADADCSKRMCPFGTDMQDVRNNQDRPFRYQTQSINFMVEDYATVGATTDIFEKQTFAVTFKSRLNETFTTIPIVANDDDPDGVAAALRSALINLPNQVIDNVATLGETVFLGNAFTLFRLNVTFTGENVMGPQHLLTVEDYKCGDGCFPKISGVTSVRNARSNNVTEVALADYNSFECGRRGKCDYGTGICECFEGFTGQSCNQCTSLI